MGAEWFKELHTNADRLQENAEALDYDEDDEDVPVQITLGQAPEVVEGF